MNLSQCQGDVPAELHSADVPNIFLARISLLLDPFFTAHSLQTGHGPRSNIVLVDRAVYQGSDSVLFPARVVFYFQVCRCLFLCQFLYTLLAQLFSLLRRFVGLLGAEEGISKALQKGDSLCSDGARGVELSIGLRTAGAADVLLACMR